MPLPPAELRECPFCKGPASEKIIYKPFLNGWVGCKPCMVYINWRNHPSDRDRAIKTWNSRPVEDKLNHDIDELLVELHDYEEALDQYQQ